MTDRNQLIQELELSQKGSRELSDRVLLACGFEKEIDESGEYWIISPDDVLSVLE